MGKRDLGSYLVQLPVFSLLGDNKLNIRNMIDVCDPVNSAYNSFHTTSEGNRRKVLSLLEREVLVKATGAGSLKT